MNRFAVGWIVAVVLAGPLEAQTPDSAAAVRDWLTAELPALAPVPPPGEAALLSVLIDRCVSIATTSEVRPRSSRPYLRRATAPIPWDRLVVEQAWSLPNVLAEPWPPGTTWLRLGYQKAAVRYEDVESMNVQRGSALTFMFTDQEAADRARVQLEALARLCR